MKRIILRYMTVAAASLMLAVLSYCGKKPAIGEKAVVARIGKHEITVEDFRMDYEFGFSHLKTGQNRKLSYLERIIDERLLSMRGYELGLQKSERVQRRTKDLEEELVIEQVFMDNVQAKVEISDEEIRDAINKSKVSWKLRYWYEPSREFAESVCAYMREHGYAETVEKILSGNPEINLTPKEFETPYITWLDVSPDLLNEIQNLELGAISDPVAMDQGFYIFQLVDIRREPVTEYDYKSRSESYRKILRARKEQELIVQFVSSLMTPMNVTTKGEAFSLLSRNLYEWLKDKDNSQELSKALAEGASDRPPLKAIQQNLKKVLVTFQGGEWTIADFLKRYRPLPADLKEGDDLPVFQAKLNDQIALAVRDDFLLKMGYKDKVERRPAVKSEIMRWRDKWVYQELRRDLTKNLEVSEEEARAYFEKYKDRFKVRKEDQPAFENNKKLSGQYAAHQKELDLLSSITDNLKAQYGVVINSAILDTITTIDFEKSRGASVQVFKRSSKRMAYPVVDPVWGM